MQNSKEWCKKSKLFYPLDIVLVLVVVVLAVVIMCLVFLPSGDRAEVYIDGDLKYTLNLDTDEVLVLDCMTIVVRGGAVHVENADCPDKLCEKTGEIKAAGSCIVCLHNNVVILVKGKSDIDAITS